MATRKPASQPEPEPQEEVTEAVAAPVAPSILERLRRNRMGALTGGLVVSLALAMLLSILVPDRYVLLALTILGVAEAVAVGAAVRYLAVERGLLTQLSAFVAAVLGMHVLGTTGMINQKLGDLGDLGGALGGTLTSGLGWDDALLASFATPAVSTGAVLTGLLAAIIAGWGTPSRD